MAFELSDFDATVPEVRAMADKMFGADFDSEQYKETALFRAIAENQPVQMEKNFSAGGICKSVDVFELMDDDQIVLQENESDECTFTGNTLNVKKSSYINNINVRTAFAVYDDECPNFIKARQKYLFGLQRAVNKIQSRLAKKVGPKLAVNADVNVHPSDISGTVNGNYTKVPTGYFEDSVHIAKFYKNAKKHHLGSDLMFINGSNFFELDFNAKYKRDGCCDTGKVFSSSAFKYTWDLDNLDAPISDAGLLPNDATMPLSFVIRNGALFFFSNNKWDNTVQKKLKSDVYAWKMPLPDLRYKNGSSYEKIYVDVRSLRVCDEGRYGTVYELVLRGGLHTGSETNSGKLGILAYYA